MEVFVSVKLYLICTVCPSLTESVNTESDLNGQSLKWAKMTDGFDKNYNEERRAIVIPQAGFYFVYLRISLNCNGESDENPSRFFMHLQKWNKGYSKTVNLTDALDVLDCNQWPMSKNLYVGQLFDLSEEDNLSVWVRDGYKMIKKAEFGAFLI